MYYVESGSEFGYIELDIWP